MRTQCTKHMITSASELGQYSTMLFMNKDLIHSLTWASLAPVESYFLALLEQINSSHVILYRQWEFKARLWRYHNVSKVFVRGCHYLALQVESVCSSNGRIGNIFDILIWPKSHIKLPLDFFKLAFLEQLICITCHSLDFVQYNNYLAAGSNVHICFHLNDNIDWVYSVKNIICIITLKNTRTA